MSQRKYVIDFKEPPLVGKEIPYFGGRTIRLMSVMPYTKANGDQSFILTWMMDGRIGTSGLRSASLNWVD